MSKITEKMRSWIKDHNIDEIEALVPDMTGNARGKIIPAYRFLKGEGVRLPEAIFMQTVTGDWPADEVYEALVHPSDRDLFLVADPDTTCFVPWAEEPTAQIIHDCVNAEGEYHVSTPSRRPVPSRQALPAIASLRRSD